MCKCANVRMCKLSPYFAEFMYRCANAWLMCKCANVRMCKLSPYFAEFMYRCANVRMFFVNARTKATICTFAHSHICTLKKNYPSRFFRSRSALRLLGVFLASSFCLIRARGFCCVSGRSVRRQVCSISQLARTSNT